MVRHFRKLAQWTRANLFSWAMLVAIAKWMRDKLGQLGVAGLAAGFFVHNERALFFGVWSCLFSLALVVVLQIMGEQS